MDCAEYLNYINGHIDGVNTQAEEALLQEHLKTCAHCRALLAQYTQLDRQLSEIPMPPTDLTQRIMAQIPKKRKRRGFLYFAAPAATLATAAILALAVFGVTNLPVFAAKSSDDFLLSESAPQDAQYNGISGEAYIASPKDSDAYPTEKLITGTACAPSDSGGLSALPVVIVRGENAASYFSDFVPMEQFSSDDHAALQTALSTLLPEFSIALDDSLFSSSDVSAYVLSGTDPNAVIDLCAGQCEVAVYYSAETPAAADSFLLMVVTPAA